MNYSIKTSHLGDGDGVKAFCVLLLEYSLFQFLVLMKFLGILCLVSIRRRYNWLMILLPSCQRTLQFDRITINRFMLLLFLCFFLSLSLSISVSSSLFNLIIISSNKSYWFQFNITISTYIISFKFFFQPFSRLHYDWLFLCVSYHIQ